MKIYVKVQNERKYWRLDLDRMFNWSLILQLR